MAQAAYDLALDVITNLQGLSLEIALATTTPVKGLSGNMEWVEVGGGLGYARQPISLVNGIKELGEGYKTANQNAITFGPATLDWGTIMGWAIFEIGGNMKLFKDFHPYGQVPIQAGVPYYIFAETLVIHIK